MIALAVILPLLLSGGGDGDQTTSGSAGSSSATTAGPSTAAPSPVPTTTSPTPSATSRSPAPSRTTGKPPANPPPTLLVKADHGPSWLVVSDAKGRRIFNALLHRGDRRSFSGPLFRVVVGDAAAVDVWVNGNHRPRGRRGAVVRFTVRG